MNFEEKVKSMSAKEIILAMVEGLKNPTVEVNMLTFGATNGKKCFGCAATNAICRIAGVKFTPKNIDDWHLRARKVKSSLEFYEVFENALDDLRLGFIKAYNIQAQAAGFAQIEKQGFDLPCLDNESYLDNLESYIKLAEFQESK